MHRGGRAAPERRSGSPGLTGVVDAPAGFEGTWALGEDARQRASRISGPFEGAPAAWAAPTGLDDLLRLVAHAVREGLPLVPRGAGTGMPGGNLGPGIVVSLAEGFNDLGPIEVDADPRTGPRIEVGAGVVLDRVQRAAAREGLRFPPLPSSARWATAGGLVSANGAGARSFGRGAAVDWLEAVEAVTALGQPLRLGPDEPFPPEIADHLPDADRVRWPAVRKNSSGYALDRWQASANPARLLAGSEGTLALLTRVTLRLEREPPCRGVRLIPVADGAGAAELAMAARELEAVACEFLGHRLLDMAGLRSDPELGPLARHAHALFLLEFEGESSAQVEAALHAAGQVGRRLGGPGIAATDAARRAALWELRHRASPLISDQAGTGRISTQFIEDSVVPPARLGDYLVGLDRILADAGQGMDAVVFGHAGDGNVHVNPLVPTGDPDWRGRVQAVLDEVVSLVADLGGTLSGEHGDGRLRAPYLERIWGAEAVRAFRQVKTAFDPDNRLNPGVILPLPGQDPLENLRPRPRDWPE
jgi:FAD/FMN-containing dehydrogenase